MTGNRSRSDAGLKVRRVPMGPDGKPLHHMYNSDAMWLTMWNQNILWGLGWPEVMDEFAASWMEYANVGGMLPRGRCCGACTSIMSGCPGSSLITCTYQKGLMTKADPLITQDPKYYFKKRQFLIRTHDSSSSNIYIQ